MIHTFASRETARLAAGQHNRRWPPDMQAKAFKQLTIMYAVERWTELRNPPGNDLHALSGDRTGQYAIRVNMQSRIVFTPLDDGTMRDVELTDYH